VTLYEKSERIKQAAYRLGFDACGIAEAKHVGESETHLRNWLDNGNHAEMGYMANHFEKRCDPTLLVENTRSVIVVALNYYPEIKQPLHLPQVAYYAYGEDYHDVIKEKLTKLFDIINSEIIPINGRTFVDSAPVLERYWAQQAGIGWVGKNNLIIIPNKGSFYLLAELLVDVELAYDSPMKSRCGNCHSCIDACPTNALEPYLLDSHKCLSYLTIEKRTEFSDKEPEHLHNRLFGCDICQTVCPWNRKSQPHQTPEFIPNPAILTYTKEQWEDLDEDSFRSMLWKSPIKRTKFSGIERNLRRIKTTRS